MNLDAIKGIITAIIENPIFNAVWPILLVRFREWIKPSAAHKD